MILCNPNSIWHADMTFHGNHWDLCGLKKHIQGKIAIQTGKKGFFFPCDGNIDLLWEQCFIYIYIYIYLCVCVRESKRPYIPVRTWGFCTNCVREMHLRAGEPGECRGHQRTSVYSVLISILCFIQSEHGRAKLPYQHNLFLLWLIMTKKADCG